MTKLLDRIEEKMPDDIQFQDSFTCPHCDRVIGKIVVINGVEFLEKGGDIFKVGRGVCGRCGSEFTFSVNDREFSKLMQRILKGG